MGFFFWPKMFGQAEARGIQRVVVRGPDVQAQDQDGEVEQAKVDHHLEDVVAAHVDRRDTAEEEHQRVADEERDHRCDRAHLAAFGQSGRSSASPCRRRRTSRQPVRRRRSPVSVPLDLAN